MQKFQLSQSRDLFSFESIIMPLSHLIDNYKLENERDSNGEKWQEKKKKTMETGFLFPEGNGTLLF